jgi:regulator of protease activity HflC (stomatin/prohibitin superfamily)
MSERTAGRVETWIDRHFIATAATFLFAIFFLLFFFKSIFITIPAGHGGALWLRFFGGTMLNFHYGEGTKMIFPWDRIYIYDLRLQQRTKTFQILTKEGLQIEVDGTMMFRVNPLGLGLITKYAGPDFADQLVMPSVGAIARLEGGKFTLEEIYATKRSEVERGVLEHFKMAVDHLIDGIKDERPEVIIDDFWFSQISLPKSLQDSIEAKLTQRQLAEQYVYILQREEQEAKRKAIEAQGIRAFQDTVSGGISENYLRWKGIDATLKLADSPNAKIVVIGSGKEGLPLILGPWESGAPAAAATPAGAQQPSAAQPSPAGGPKASRQALPSEPTALTTGINMPALPPVGLSGRELEK